MKFDPAGFVRISYHIIQIQSYWLIRQQKLPSSARRRVRRCTKAGILWNDPSGILLRKWMQVEDQLFYDLKIFAIVPMGFCYRGKLRGQTENLIGSYSSA